MKRKRKRRGERRRIEGEREGGAKGKRTSQQREMQYGEDIYL